MTNPGELDPEVNPGVNPEESLSFGERLGIMQEKGWEQVMPGTERRVRLRTVEPAHLLRSGNCPDILTPLMLQSIYDDISDDEVRRWLENPSDNVEQALKYMDSIDAVVASAIADNTSLETLTLREKKWIFRLVLGAAEALVFFRYQRPPTTVESLAQIEPSSEPAE